MMNKGLRRKQTTVRGGEIHGGPIVKEMSWGWIWRSRERASFGEEGEGHSMQRGWKRKMLGNQKRKIWYEEPGEWEYKKLSGEYGRMCTVEDSHRDKTEEQCTWYIYSRECGSCTECYWDVNLILFRVLNSLWDWKPVERLKLRTLLQSK